jgi:hypothetical protein
VTVINLALHRDRALIVADELITGGTVPLAMSKVMPYPHLRLVAAVAGHHLVALEVAVYLGSGCPAGRDVHDVVAELPDVLRTAWAERRLTSATTVHVVGIDAADEAAAFRLDSAAGFEPRRLAPGVWLSPAFKPDAVTTVEPPPGERAETTQETPAAPPAAWVWSDATQAALDAVRRQHREHPESIGGRVTMTLLSPDSISTSWPFTLPELA